MGIFRFHIIIDLQEVSEDKLTDKIGLEGFLLKFPSLIGMNILAGPLVSEGVAQNPGLSGFVLIDYSHISVHTFTISQQALVDIFSCKEYDQKEAVKVALSYFNVDKHKAKIQKVSWANDSSVLI